MNKSELRELVRQVMSEEEAKEPEIIQIARRIVKNHQYEKVKDPVTGKKHALDGFSASAIVGVYDKLSDKNKAHMVKQPLPKMVSLVFKLIK
jgi:hydroxylamine reductase (hybrid-cluster protein)